MKIMVGLNEDRFFAYDISTLEKLKKAYSEHVGDFKPWCKKPETGKEEIESLPERFKREVMYEWDMYERSLKAGDEFNRAKNEILNANTEAELLELAYEHADTMEFYINCRGVCQIIELK